MWRVLYVVASLIRPFFVRIQVVGQENVPLVGGCLYAINHTMGPDYLLVGYTSPRQVYYMAKSELFGRQRWMEQLVAAAGAFPVRRGQGDREALERAVLLVRGGKVVGMFPEGTRSRNGRLQRGKTGVARIALLAGVPVVPVAVIGCEAIGREAFTFKRRPLVTVCYGCPLVLEGDAENVADVERWTTAVMEEVAALLPEERRGHYGAVGGEVG